ncbi:MAG: TolC family protein [Synergistaceae bacterium]|nr:TolC family protein [Synergistaceae bacterium]
MTVACAILISAVPLSAEQENSARAFAETVSTDVITLTMADAINIALSENIKIQSASEDVVRAIGDSKANSSGLYPTIELSGTANKKIENAFNGDTGEERNAGIKVSYTLYSGGKNSALNEQGKLGVKNAEDTLFDTKESVILSVWKAYCTVLYRKEVLVATTGALDYYTKAVQEQTRRLELGASTNLDLSRMKQQFESAHANHISAGNDLDSSHAALCLLLRISPKIRLKLTGNLSDGLPDKGMLTKATVDEFEITYKNALARRGDYQALIAQREIDKKEIMVAASGMKPRVSLSGGYAWNYEKYTYIDLDSTDEWNAKISISVPLFDGGKTEGETVSAKSTYKQSNLSVQDKEDEIKVSLIDAHLTLVNALGMADAGRAEVEYGRQSLKYAEVGYREGVNTQLDLIQARTDLTNAQKNYAEYLYECRVAQASLWREEGILTHKTVFSETSDRGVK